MNLLTSEITEDLIQIIGFSVGPKLFGADIMSVREILRDPAIESIEAKIDYISGFIHHRGLAIPTLDLRMRMGKSAEPVAESKNWVLISQVKDVTLGLVADAVTRIFRVKPDSILPAPEMIYTGRATSYIKGVYESELGMLVVLDVNDLLTEDEINALKGMDLR